jgi:hypothetical protein
MGPERGGHAKFNWLPTTLTWVVLEEILENILTRLKLPRGKGKKAARGGQGRVPRTPLSRQTAG